MERPTAPDALQDNMLQSIGTGRIPVSVAADIGGTQRGPGRQW